MMRHFNQKCLVYVAKYCVKKFVAKTYLFSIGANTQINVSEWSTTNTLGDTVFLNFMKHIDREDIRRDNFNLWTAFDLDKDGHFHYVDFWWNPRETRRPWYVAELTDIDDCIESKQSAYLDGNKKSYS